MRDARGDDSAKGGYATFVKRSAPSARGPTAWPTTPKQWDERLRGVAGGLRDSLGPFPEEPCDLEPEILGVVERDGYVIERLTFQSRPGVRVTANLYRPESVSGRLPAVLSVHGHWSWARIDPGVQVRCVGLAKLGYVCLCVDAFGAGERAIEPGPGTYHGGPIGAGLWTVGRPLIGLQVYDNRRAVDYLISRPEVDPEKLAVTGASGGGNQSLYAGATDDRLKAIVPVCGIGTYEAYLEAACCVCEVNPDGLSYATTGDLLAMMAPRALLVISATRDAPQFGVAAASKSVAYARSRFEGLDAADRLRFLAIESGHDYNQPMREAMYGWLDRWLRDRGDGGPVAEPEVQTEDPALLRCHPDAASRPKSIVTIPEFTHREGLARLAELPAPPDHPEAWEAESVLMRAEIAERLLGGLPSSSPPPPNLWREPGSDFTTMEIRPEPGIVLSGRLRVPGPGAQAKGTAVLLADRVLDADGVRNRVDKLTRDGWAVCAVELRATGRLKPETNPVAGAADHNEAEWGVWLGRPLLGQWVGDALGWIDAIDRVARSSSKHLPEAFAGLPLALHSMGPIGVVSILTAAFEPRIDSVTVENSLVSYVAPEPSTWSGLPMGLIAPHVVEAGDVARFAALVAPRRLRVIGGVETDGQPASDERLNSAFAFAKSIFQLLSAPKSLTLTVSRAEEELPPERTPTGNSSDAT